MIGQRFWMLPSSIRKKNQIRELNININTNRPTLLLHRRNRTATTWIKKSHLILQPGPLTELRPRISIITSNTLTLWCCCPSQSSRINDSSNKQYWVLFRLITRDGPPHISTQNLRSLEYDKKRIKATETCNCCNKPHSHLQVCIPMTSSTAFKRIRVTMTVEMKALVCSRSSRTTTPQRR